MLDDYIKAQKIGERTYKARAAKGEYPFLPALDDIAPDTATMTQKELGMFEIPTWLIEGTKTRARQNSFAPDFMPLLSPDSEFGMKWSNLYEAQMEEGFNSPIKVYEYLHRFYVLEGNKRVSVSRYLEMPTIMADVTRIIPPDEILRQHPIYAEFLDFYKVAPIYDLDCTVPGSYHEIAELLGCRIGEGAEPWPEDLVRSLQSSYWRFSKVAAGRKGRMPDMPSGDAFLVYLRVYSRDAMNMQPDKELDKRLTKIKKELLTAKNDEKVSLIESSDEVVKAGDLFIKASSVITKPGSLISKVLPVSTYTAKHPLKAAFIYDKHPDKSNWISDHEAGRKSLSKIYGKIIKTKAFLGIQPSTSEDAVKSTGKSKSKIKIYGNTEEAIDAAASWGADVVFTVSPRQMDVAMRQAIKYEDIMFLNCSINLARQSVRTYYGKLYEAKFLAGMVAAIHSDNHKIGYCSDYPIYGTIAGINAFAIGAAMVDPDVKIYLEWATKQNVDWWRAMEEKGIRVISAANSIHPANGSNAYGVFKIEEDGSLTHLAQTLWNWGKFYEIIVKTILEGTYNAKLVNRKDQATNYWWGMQSGVVDINLDDSLSPYTKKLVDMFRRDLISGVSGPFDGSLTSQNGCIKRENDPPLTSMDIIKMDWLNENIIGEIPEKDTLTEEAKSTVSVSGVKA